ncbi:hypothetical protein ACFX1X_002448 [Malus domestica]
MILTPPYKDLIAQTHNGSSLKSKRRSNSAEIVCFIKRRCVQKIHGSRQHKSNSVEGLWLCIFFQSFAVWEIFFDPSDAFLLWEFESDILLSGLRSSGQNCIDWFQIE